MAACGTALAAAACGAQAFNIDVEIFSGGEGIGAGAPSSEFGAAGGQAGLWNPVQLNAIPWHLRDIYSHETAAFVTAEYDVGNGGGPGGFYFKGNTGDYARLLNDAQRVATILQGGGMVCTFHGLLPGDYELYTYAVNITGEFVPTSVYVPGSIGAQSQVVTGPMPGNSFEYLVTHSIHYVHLAAGDELYVEFYQPPNTRGQDINGFQIVPVPEANLFLMTISGCVFLIIRRKRVL